MIAQEIVNEIFSCSIATGSVRFLFWNQPNPCRGYCCLAISPAWNIFSVTTDIHLQILTGNLSFIIEEHYPGNVPAIEVIYEDYVVDPQQQLKLKIISCIQALKNPSNPFNEDLLDYFSTSLFADDSIRQPPYYAKEHLGLIRLLFTNSQQVSCPIHHQFRIPYATSAIPSLPCWCTFPSIQIQWDFCIPLHSSDIF